MLGHQLLTYLTSTEFLKVLPELFDWLEEKYIPEILETIPSGKNEEISWRPPIGVTSWGFNVSLESIRFAAVNHLCIELGYNGTKRIIEPYSLRRTKEGNLLLYAVRVDNNKVRAYRVDRIESVEITNIHFSLVSN
jgi:hypothetical protein